MDGQGPRGTRLLSRPLLPLEPLLLGTLALPHLLDLALHADPTANGTPVTSPALLPPRPSSDSTSSKE